MVIKMNVIKVMLVLLVVMAFGLQGCGGGGDSGGGEVITEGNSTAGSADFTGTWSGAYNGTALSYLITQSGKNFSMTRTTPISTGMTYNGTVSGDSAVVNTYGNGTYMGNTTWTKLNSTTITGVVNSCISIQGFSCGAPNGSTVTLRKRFVDNGNGTIYDPINNLSWLKDVTCLGRNNWDDATSKSNSLASGQCGLTDGSKAGDWHLPTMQEFITMNETSGHNIYPNYLSTYNYWSSESYAGLMAHTYNGYMQNIFEWKSSNFIYAWPVRSGQ